MDVVKISLSQILNSDAPLTNKDVIPLWALSRTCGSKAMDLPAASSLLDYCRVQLKATNGARFEQSAALFMYFSEFFRRQVVSATASSAADTEKDSAHGYVSCELATEEFLEVGAHFVPVEILVDIADNDGEEFAATLSSAIYPCWGIKAPRSIGIASQSPIHSSDGKPVQKSRCRLPSSLGGELVDLIPSAGFAVTLSSSSASAARISDDEKEITHLLNDFFFEFSMLSSVYKSKAPTGLVVSQHAALLTILKDFRTKAIKLNKGKDEGGNITESHDSLVASTGKAISMKVPAQAVWRFNLFEGVASAGDDKVTHSSPILALDSEFLGSLMVYLRKLEREEKAREKKLAIGSDGATSDKGSTNGIKPSTSLPPIQWKDLDRNQKRRVREIASLLGLEPLYEYILTNIAVDAADPESTRKKEAEIEEIIRSKNAPETLDSQTADPDAQHREQDLKDTMGLIERTMLISALNEQAGLKAVEQETDTKDSKLPPTTCNNESSSESKAHHVEDNEQWVREFRAKVANFSRVDALMEERNKQLKAVSAAGGQPSSEKAASQPVAFVPPHPSVDDDDLEMPMGGACYKCGVSGHTAEECKY